MSGRKAREFWISPQDPETFCGPYVFEKPCEECIHVREILPDDELEKLRAENEQLRKNNEQLGLDRLFYMEETAKLRSELDLIKAEYDKTTALLAEEKRLSDAFKKSLFEALDDNHSDNKKIIEIMNLYRSKSDQVIRFAQENEKLRAKNERLVQTMIDVRSEMTRRPETINYSWCIDQICEAIKETSDE